MGNSRVRDAFRGLWKWCRKAWARIKAPVAIVVLLVLAASMYFFNNPYLTIQAKLSTK